MQVEEIVKPITPILKRYNVKRVEWFGSVAREEDTSGSDIDMVVSFSQPAGLISYSQFTRQSKDAAGVGINVISEGGIKIACSLLFVKIYELYMSRDYK
jgi:uncharacterized protein